MRIVAILKAVAACVCAALLISCSADVQVGARLENALLQSAEAPVACTVGGGLGRAASHAVGTYHSDPFANYTDELADIDSGDVDELTAHLGLGATATVTVPSGTLPEQITITELDATARIHEELPQPSVANVEFSAATNIVLTHQTGNTYAVANHAAVDLMAVLTAQNDAATLQQAFSILKTGGDNTVSIDALLDLDSTPTLPDGAVVSLTFEGGDVQVVVNDI